ncbi:hypothetical protein [Halarcobacter anaerophilus]|uniref:Uncharacterized protein n=1 Tax=Halarcobacter anaerophilus TaxID=877500 RepID=A0A4Q0Y1T3_9BACT|nr:hypothetical protein [Halarcobacter anaerophilus]QDF28988.1 hypothetical protein AANAER_1508 [Halarcobacter anaerophilus]RXJ63623.1 hypothetical protein CRV06_05365 [Halarcobacter anaerophilus]
MSNKIHTPNLRALRYKGDFSKKLFEVRADKLPILEKGDFVIVDKMTSVSLKRRGLFEEVEISDVFVGENKTSFNFDELTDEQLVELVEVLTDRGILKTQSLVPEQENQDDNPSADETLDDISDVPGDTKTDTKDEDSLDEIPAIPTKDEIDSLSDDDIKKWCTHFGITIGRKQVATLKGLLLPYLADTQE